MVLLDNILYLVPQELFKNSLQVTHLKKNHMHLSSVDGAARAGIEAIYIKLYFIKLYDIKTITTF